MAIDRWFIGGGAEHTPESARRLVYASTGGAEGVGGTNDLKVLPLAVPGQGVRVTVGSALIKSRYVGGETQTYMGTVYTQEEVETTPTGSGGGRSDLIYMSVEDPFAAGSPYSPPAEEDIATAPYIHIRVASGVPANTKKLQDVPGYANHTGLALARIDFPASSGTVTSGMITDLRIVAQPRRTEVLFARPRIAADDGAQQFLTAKVSTGGEFFPGGAGVANQFQVDVPEWATHMIIDARWMSVTYRMNPWGRYWVEFGDEYRNHTWPDNKQYEFTTQHFHFNAPSTGTDEKAAEWSLMDTLTVAQKLRGKRITFVFKAGRQDTESGQNVWMSSLGGLGMRITFSEGLIDPNII